MLLSEIVKYIRAAYAIGVNPLPALRKKGIECEYHKNLKKLLEDIKLLAEEVIHSVRINDGLYMLYYFLEKDNLVARLDEGWDVRFDEKGSPIEIKNEKGWEKYERKS